jgi:hypothetical protein
MTPDPVNIDGELIEVTCILIIVAIFIIYMFKDEDNKQSKSFSKLLLTQFKHIIIEFPSDPTHFLNKFVYQLNGAGKRKQGCFLVNGFVISHIALFGYLAYIFPSKREMLFIFGVCWEILEGRKGQNNNLDIFFNIIGLIASSI